MGRGQTAVNSVQHDSIACAFIEPVTRCCQAPSPQHRHPGPDPGASVRRGDHSTQQLPLLLAPSRPPPPCSSKAAFEGQGSPEGVLGPMDKGEEGKPASPPPIAPHPKISEATPKGTLDGVTLSRPPPPPGFSLGVQGVPSFLRNVFSFPHFLSRKSRAFVSQKSPPTFPAVPRVPTCGRARADEEGRGGGPGFCTQGRGRSSGTRPQDLATQGAFFCGGPRLLDKHAANPAGKGPTTAPLDLLTSCSLCPLRGFFSFII